MLMHAHTCTHRRELSGHMTTPILSTRDESPDTSNDLLLAQMLQLEFDRQHDRLVGAEERVYNRDSKGEGEKGRREGGGVQQRQ